MLNFRQNFVFSKMPELFCTCGLQFVKSENIAINVYVCVCVCFFCQFTFLFKEKSQKSHTNVKSANEMQRKKQNNREIYFLIKLKAKYKNLGTLEQNKTLS